MNSTARGLNITAIVFSFIKTFILGIFALLVFLGAAIVSTEYYGYTDSNDITVELFSLPIPFIIMAIICLIAGIMFIVNQKYATLPLTIISIIFSVLSASIFGLIANILTAVDISKGNNKGNNNNNNNNLNNSNNNYNSTNQFSTRSHNSYNVKDINNSDYNHN